MENGTLRDVIIGIFNFCPTKKLPADASAIHKAFWKFEKLHPQYFTGIQFKQLFGGPCSICSSQLDDMISEMLFGDLIGMSGEKLEHLILSKNLKSAFDSNLFTKEEAKTIKLMGEMLPKLLTNSESQRYRHLKETMV